MDKDTGVGASPSGGLSSCGLSRSVSTVPASIPDAVWVLFRQTGCYDDYRETPIAAFFSAQAAEEARDTAYAELAEAKEKFPEPVSPDEATDEEWDEWEAAGDSIAEAFRKSLTVDPDAGPHSAWTWLDSDLGWIVTEVPLRAKQFPPQDESAVPQECAQTTTGEQSHDPS